MPEFAALYKEATAIMKPVYAYSRSLPVEQRSIYIDSIMALLTDSARVQALWSDTNQVVQLMHASSYQELLQHIVKMKEAAVAIKTSMVMASINTSLLNRRSANASLAGVQEFKEFMALDDPDNTVLVAPANCYDECDEDCCFCVAGMTLEMAGTVAGGFLCPPCIVIGVGLVVITGRGCDRERTKCYKSCN